MKCLIALGADINAKTNSNQTALELAKSDEMYNVIKAELQKKIDKQQEINDKKSQNKDDISQSNLELIDDSDINCLERNVDEQIISKGTEKDDVGSSSIDVKESVIRINNHINQDAPDLKNEVQLTKACELIKSESSVHLLAGSSDQTSGIENNGDIIKISTDKEEDSILGLRKMPSKSLQKRKKISRFSGQSFVLSHLENGDDDVDN